MFNHPSQPLSTFSGQVHSLGNVLLLLAKFYFAPIGLVAITMGSAMKLPQQWRSQVKLGNEESLLLDLYNGRHYFLSHNADPTHWSWLCALSHRQSTWPVFRGVYFSNSSLLAWIAYHLGTTTKPSAHDIRQVFPLVGLPPALPCNPVHCGSTKTCDVWSWCFRITIKLCPVPPLLYAARTFK